MLVSLPEICPGTLVSDVEPKSHWKRSVPSPEALTVKVAGRLASTRASIGSVSITGATGFGESTSHL